jgi:glycosyltransferase involved in cell wall biosynthesis
MTDQGSLGVNEEKKSLRLPRCVIITPARNEEEHLEGTILAMASQTVHPLKWIIVNDGSTDATPAIIDRYASQFSWIERLDMPAHRDRSFAAKANCVNAAYQRAAELQFDVIGNIDADVSFEPDYLEFLFKKFAEISDLGVAGTPLQAEGGYDTAKDSFEGENYVAGPVQLFRRSCFEDVGGYVPNKAGGVDWIAVTTARMKGWKTQSFPEKRYFHHRSFGTADRSPLSALYSYGEKDYYLGGSPLWEICRVAYRSVKRPALLGGLALGIGFLSATIRRIPRAVSPELMRFHRQEQMQKLRAIVRTLLHLKKVDAFSVMAPRDGIPKGSTRT